MTIERPCRKTDVLDCQWLQQLHTYGLLSGAFRPEADIRRLRSYLRQRAMLVRYTSHHIQHMQKALTQMNVKLQHVISNITGKTGLDIIAAIVSGERDPHKLAQFRRPGVKADQDTFAKSLRGHWREEHIFELTQALELYRFYHAKIAECDREIAAQLEQFEDRSDGGSPAENGRRRSQGNAPRFDIRTHLYRMTGVNLTRIDGVDGFTALKVISEIGADMTKWPSAKHFASWLGLSPDNRVTGGQGQELQDQAQRQSGCSGVASGRPRAAPLRQCPGCLSAPEESSVGRTQGDHRHGAQADQAHLFHAAVRAGLRGRRRRLLRKSVSAAGVARCQASGRPTGLPTGAHVRCSRTQHAGASWHANCRVSTQLVGSPADGILAITGDETADACGIVSY